MSAAARTEWTEGLDFEIPVVTDHIPDDVEWLYWVGCAGALDDRARRSTQAIARVFRAAGVKFAILGPTETCTGDPARRIGNEYLFQEMAKANIEILDNAGAKKIVASCPHCFNTIGNEYPSLGGHGIDAAHGETEMIEAAIGRDRRRIDAVARGDRRNKNIGAAKLEIDARLALLHAANDLGAEHRLEPFC